MRWTRKSIVAEIKELHSKGVELNYATAEAENLNLVRAAAWHFGTWRRAVEAAGIAYESICKYRRWNRDRIIARIRELNDEKADLSWRSISTEIDPPLAAAALRPNGFRTWREAIAAAGLNIDEVARYQCWTEDRVLREIKSLKRNKEPLSSKAVQSSNQPLFCAARRRFGSWDEALAHAGFSAAKIRLRRPASQTETKALNAAVASLVKSPAAGRAAVKASGKNGGIEQKPLIAAPAKAAAKPAARTAVAAKAATAKAVAAKKAAAKPAAKTVAAKPTAAKPTAAKPTAAKPTASKPAAKAVATRTAAAKAKPVKAAAPAAPTKAKPAAKRGKAVNTAQLSFDISVPAPAPKAAAKKTAAKTAAKPVATRAAAKPAAKTAVAAKKAPVRAIAARPVQGKAAPAKKVAAKAAPAKAKAPAAKAAAKPAPKAAAKATKRR